MTTDAKPLPLGWIIVALLFAAGALNYIDRIMITTMRWSVMAAIPMTDAQFGLLSSVFLWVYGGLSPFAGFLADRFNRSKVIIGSLLAWSAITWLTVYATTFEELMVTRVLLGISTACYLPAALALIADYHRGSTRSFASGIHQAGVSVGHTLAGLGGWMAERNGWAHPFFLFGVIGVVYSLGLCFVLRDPPRPAVTVATSAPQEKLSFVSAIRSLFSSPQYILALLFWGLLGTVGWAISGWAPTYFKEHFHLSQGQAGLYAVSYRQIAAVVGMLLGGFLADRWSRTNPRGRILVPAIGLCFAAVGILAMANTPLTLIGIVGMMIYGLTRTFTDANIMPILCLVCDARYRATGLGVLNAASCLVGGGAIYIGGALRDANVPLGKLYTVSGLSLFACAAILFCLKPVKPAEVAK